MFTESTKDDLLPQVAFAPVVLCPRAAQVLFDDSEAVDIGIALESTGRIYSDSSRICEGCRNRFACRSRMKRDRRARAMEQPRDTVLVT